MSIRKSKTVYLINSHQNLEALLITGRITNREFSYLDDVLETVGPFLLQGDKIRDVVSIRDWVEIPNVWELRR